MNQILSFIFFCSPSFSFTLFNVKRFENVESVRLMKTTMLRYCWMEKCIAPYWYCCYPCCCCCWSRRDWWIGSRAETLLKPRLLQKNCCTTGHRPIYQMIKTQIPRRCFRPDVFGWLRGVAAEES